MCVPVQWVEKDRSRHLTVSAMPYSPAGDPTDDGHAGLAGSPGGGEIAVSSR
ncbi:hypothetical protein L2X99_16975 [Microbacterium sp. KUDC0406]|uniref:hypothetical protein n=1 Tax=Microbacterium sp. KUDC0406 TaxID=2909588 RepID=UPI001F2F02A5|nr:hypothetical protein [Microbacterium sp. KUDC0406]UJP10025.1 hypothetical protein L2X99_16975 [Microbacterium sp. KUDC0406]